VIKVNNFYDVAKDSLDQWIYYFKNNEIKDTFTAKGIEKAKELWRVEKLTEDERKRYLKHLEDLRYSASMAWSVKVDSEDKLRKEKAVEIASNLKLRGVDINIIVQATGLSTDEVEKL
jgi:hypothetical protein